MWPAVTARCWAERWYGLSTGPALGAHRGGQAGATPELQPLTFLTRRPLSAGGHRQGARGPCDGSPGGGGPGASPPPPPARCHSAHVRHGGTEGDGGTWPSGDTRPRAAGATRGSRDRAWSSPASGRRAVSVGRRDADGHHGAPGPGQPHATASSPRQGSPRPRGLRPWGPLDPRHPHSRRTHSGCGGFCGFLDSGDRPELGW